MRVRRFKASFPAHFPIAAIVIIVAVIPHAETFLAAEVYGSEPYVIPVETVELPNGRSVEIEKSSFIVKFQAGTPAERTLEILKDHHLAVKHQQANLDWMVVELQSTKPLKDTLLRLSGLKEIEFVTPNYICRADGKPRYRFLKYQWNLFQTDFVKAWKIRTASPHVVVAVLDSGVAYESYTDTTGEYFQAPQLASVPFLPGPDLINHDAHPNDDFGHGTHMASIIASGPPGESSTAGAASGCTIMPIKVLDKEGKGTVASLTQGIMAAVEGGAHIINMSLSFPYGLRPVDLSVLHDAIQYAGHKNILSVASSGNDGLPWANYPSAFNACISVGGIRKDGRRASYSNFGLALDVVAPGGSSDHYDRRGYPEAILAVSFSSDTPDSFGYWFGAGTSQAAAHVTALAALLVSEGVTDALAVRNAILKTASPLPGYVDPVTGHNVEMGYGEIDAREALRRYASIQVDSLENLHGYLDQ